MGYCMDQGDTSFEMKKENFGGALEAIMNLMGKVQEEGGGGVYSRGRTVKHFSWVGTDDVLTSTTFEDAMAEWRWELELDKDGNVSDLYFSGEKLGDDMLLFEAIAPFVVPESYICMRGEDGAMWRWYFNGKECREQWGTTHYE